jgi:hypothetical protein
MATEGDVKHLPAAAAANPDLPPSQTASTSIAQSSQKDELLPVDKRSSIPMRTGSFSLQAARSQRQQPVQDTELGTRVLESLQSFLPLIISITIFGASTFASLVSQLAELVSKFSLGTVRNFMAIAWVLFIVALGVAMFGVTIIKPDETRSRKRGTLRLLVEIARLVKMLCQMLVMIAFLFLSLVVVAYAGPAGWVAVGLTAYGILTTIGFWVQWAIKPTSSDPMLCD